MRGSNEWGRECARRAEAKYLLSKAEVSTNPKSPYRPRNPEKFKDAKGATKEGFGVPANVTQKLLKSNSQVTKTVENGTFE